MPMCVELAAAGVTEIDSSVCHFVTEVICVCQEFLVVVLIVPSVMQYKYRVIV